MKKLNHAAAFAAFALVACQQQAPTNVVNATNSATAAKLPTRIPDHFQGRWGLNKADCTSTRGDAKGLLTISDARLTFYEARGTLDKVIGATDTSFAARYSFSGEGQTWMRTERFSLVKAELHRTTDAEPGQEPPVNLTYARCPG